MSSKVALCIQGINFILDEEEGINAFRSLSKAQVYNPWSDKVDLRFVEESELELKAAGKLYEDVMGAQIAGVSLGEFRRKS